MDEIEHRFKPRRPSRNGKRVYVKKVKLVTKPVEKTRFERREATIKAVEKQC